MRNGHAPQFAQHAERQARGGVLTFAERSRIEENGRRAMFDAADDVAPQGVVIDFRNVSH